MQPIEKKNVKNLEGDGLAGALARALAERARVIHSDSSTSDSSEGDDDWDDWVVVIIKQYFFIYIL